MATVFSVAAESRERINFDEGWRFTLGDSVQMAQTDYDDSSWRQLDLPHDWAIEGDFLDSNPSGAGGGSLPGGVGWYRKHLRIDRVTDNTSRWYIDIDGAYMNSTVYINGKKLGTRPYGYSSFRYELTQYLNPEGDNVVAVRVDNGDQPNSRWYSGCGIYRHVWLVQVSPVSIAHWGTFVQPTVLSNGQAKFQVDVTIENAMSNKVKAKVRNTLYDSNMNRITSSESTIQLEPKTKGIYKPEDDGYKKLPVNTQVFTSSRISRVV